MKSHPKLEDVFFRKVSSDKSKTIVYIHGLGESSLCFDSLISDKQFNEYNHISFDLPGYGKSNQSNSPMTLMQYSGLIKELISAKKLGSVILLGHSMGGVIGQLMAEQYPGIVSHFINVEGNISIGDCTFSGRAAASERDEFISMKFSHLKEAIAKNSTHNQALQGYYTSMCMADPDQFYLNSVELVQYSKKEDLACRFSMLPMPSLYIVGTPDGTCDTSKELLRTHKVRWIEIEPAGHWPFIDQPDLFITSVLHFLQSDIPAVH